jgi:hypothetical protein
MPAVNYDLMYQAMVHQAKGDSNQILYWSRLPSWNTRRSRRRDLPHAFHQHEGQGPTSGEGGPCLVFQ